MEELTTHTAQVLDSFDQQIWLHRLPFLFVRWVTSLPYLTVTLPWKDMDTLAWSPIHLKCQWPPEIPFLLLRPLVEYGNSHSLHPKQDYSADLNLAPTHPSFKRRTNSYWPWMAFSQLIKCISPSVSGRPISLLYLRDRLTSAQKLPRNEADKEELLWPFSRAHFFLPLLPLGLVKLVWAAYQEPREPHQSAWISSVVWCLWSGCEKAPASTYVLGPLACLWSCTTTTGNIHPCPVRGSSGSENQVRKSSLSKHRAAQPDRLLQYPPARWGNQRGYSPVLQLHLESHIHLLLTEKTWSKTSCQKMNIYADILAYGLGPSGLFLSPSGFSMILNTEKLTEPKQAEEQKKQPILWVFCMDRLLSLLQNHLNITHIKQLERN